MFGERGKGAKGKRRVREHMRQAERERASWRKSVKDRERERERDCERQRRREREAEAGTEAEAEAEAETGSVVPVRLLPASCLPLQKTDRWLRNLRPFAPCPLTRAGLPPCEFTLVALVTGIAAVFNNLLQNSSYCRSGATPVCDVRCAMCNVQCAMLTWCCAWRPRRFPLIHRQPARAGARSTRGETNESKSYITCALRPPKKR